MTERFIEKMNNKQLPAKEILKKLPGFEFDEEEHRKKKEKENLDLNLKRV